MTFDLGAAPPAAEELLVPEVPTTGTGQASPSAVYRVLARKYRPSNFAELIGQDALVRTLTNAFQQNRIAHAFMLTGVRGVGKTTTARIIARALNCIGPDGNGGPTIEPCGVCQNCIAIAADRHVDVIEMDAASRTGVDDVRELIEGVRYSPSSARYKVYIIDEVHMLSKQAFNALLKTLEEPPAHVKFLFATTEIRKVPITVLSRCQRFDLKRVDGALLTGHFASIAEKEGASLEDEALSLIARAADGSVRDGLSLLDQAISRGAGTVTAEQVRDMLGLADRTIVIDLFDAGMRGDASGVLDIMGSLHAAGADPVVVLQDLLEFVHFLTRLKLTGETASIAAPEAERVRGGALAEKLSMPVLTRAWQLLLKGLGEVQHAPNPNAAAEMVLLRLVFAADLPPPADLVRQLTQGGAPGVAGGAPGGGGGGAPRAPMAMGGGGAALALAQPLQQPQQFVDPAQAQALALEPAPQIYEPMPASYRDAVGLFAKRREGILEFHLSSSAHLVRFEPGRIELNLLPTAPRDLANRVGQMLTDWTGHRWVVSITGTAGEVTLAAQDDAAKTASLRAAEAHPTVAAILTAFPGAKILEIRDLTQPEGEVPPVDADAGPPDLNEDLEFLE